mgnify:CR=1 FL=1
MFVVIINPLNPGTSLSSLITDPNALVTVSLSL